MAQPTTPAHDRGTATIAHTAPMSWAIMQLAHTQRSYAAERLAALGLFPGQELILDQLWRSDDGCSQKKLGELLRLDHSTIAKSVQRLERNNLVHRERSPQDGRVTIVRVTDAGRALESPVRSVWTDMESRWQQRLGDADGATVAAALSALAAGPSSD